MAVDEFSRSVDMGLRLSKRIYYGKDANPCMNAPKPPSMEKSLSTSSSASSFRLPQNHHPTAPMVYAVINEPAVVDNPDIRSYQPYVYGRCDPPALIPLHMLGAMLEVDCYLDTAFVTFNGTWRVHCLASTAFCDCRITIPMGEQLQVLVYSERVRFGKQGLVLGVEVETKRRSYFSQLIYPEDEKDNLQETTKDGFLMKGNTYTFQILQVEGGSSINVKVKWSQKLLFQGNDFCLNVPFTFPVHVFPVFKKSPCREKIVLNVDSGTCTAIMCNIASHPIKELKKQSGQLCFMYEAEAVSLDPFDQRFGIGLAAFCKVCSSEIFGGLLLQSPSLHDYDQREIFLFYLFPGSNRSIKPFKKEVVFVVDTSSCMQDGPIQKVKYEIIGSLWKLNQEDSFNIVASNGQVKSFSTSLVMATKETITNATEWMNTNLIADGATNLLLPLEQAIDMVGKTSDSKIPLIFLITDGAVEDEPEICNMMKAHLVNCELNSPRIFTFGIGSYCNHYFLQMLANIGRGYYDSAFDVDPISIRLQKLLDDATTPVLSNVTLDDLQYLESHEIFPYRFPDLSSGRPLIVSGRFKGNFPDIVKATGFLALDKTSHVIDIKVRKANDVPLEMAKMVHVGFDFKH
ncbi:uncharacterized protein [Rutidosis leptorrhynchoides]|uniref:uncharacterized protein n=1 Tax=Rutidosis leptorrhynchoides TaxID=125765 RepID=UPI003A994ED9